MSRYDIQWRGMSTLSRFLSLEVSKTLDPKAGPTHERGPGPPARLKALFRLLYGDPLRTGSFAKQGVKAWSTYLAANPRAAEIAYSGRLFSPPVAWPSGWPAKWPKHITPTVFASAMTDGEALGRWIVQRWWFNFPGSEELGAFVLGWPLTREQQLMAIKGARSLMTWPQFNIWAYNINAYAIRRLDVSPEYQASHLVNVDRYPLFANCRDIAYVLSAFTRDPLVLRGAAGTFDPLRGATGANLLRTVDDELTPPQAWDGVLPEYVDPSPYRPCIPGPSTYRRNHDRFIKTCRRPR